MNEFSLGVISSLSPSPQAALETIHGLGLTHIQLQYPARLDSPEGIESIKAAAEQFGIEITTVFCGFEGESYNDIPTVGRTVGFVPPATRSERIEKTLAIAEFAHKLGVQRIAAHIGCIPEEAGADRDELVAAVATICDKLAANNQVFALETGQETAKGLLEYIKLVNRPNLKVNFDPANMILYGNDKPIPATQLLFPYIDGVHCKDGCWPTQPDQIGQEMPWGQGDVDARRWVETLLELGYRGPFTIEREIEGKEQIRDIQSAVSQLEGWLHEWQSAHQ